MYLQSSPITSNEVSSKSKTQKRTCVSALIKSGAFNRTMSPDKGILSSSLPITLDQRPSNKWRNLISDMSKTVDDHHRQELSSKGEDTEDEFSEISVDSFGFSFDDSKEFKDERLSNSKFGSNLDINEYLVSPILCPKISDKLPRESDLNWNNLDNGKADHIHSSQGACITGQCIEEDISVFLNSSDEDYDESLLDELEWKESFREENIGKILDNCKDFSLEKDRFNERFEVPSLCERIPVDLSLQEKSDESEFSDSDQAIWDVSSLEEVDCMNTGLMSELAQHIRKSGLNLTFRSETRSDGNCWYDAIADQIILHKVPGLPTNHADLRRSVVAAIPSLPQAEHWQVVLGDEDLETFLKSHSVLGMWTDDLGVMCQATALYVGRAIHVVGTANIGQMGCGFTTLESVDGSEDLEPFTVGYLQDHHYQSLQKVDLKQPLSPALLPRSLF